MTNEKMKILSSLYCTYVGYNVVVQICGVCVHACVCVVMWPCVHAKSKWNIEDCLKGEGGKPFSVEEMLQVSSKKQY